MNRSKLWQKMSNIKEYMTGSDTWWRDVKSQFKQMSSIKSLVSSKDKTDTRVPSRMPSNSRRALVLHIRPPDSEASQSLYELALTSRQFILPWPQKVLQLLQKTDKGLFRAVETMVLNTRVPFWNIFATNLQNLCWIPIPIGLQCESNAMTSQCLSHGMNPPYFT